MVLYGDKSNWWAAYALWVMSLFGTRTPGCSTEAAPSGSPRAASSTKDASPRRPSTPWSIGTTPPSAFKDDVLNHLGGPLVDVRSPGEFSGACCMPDYPQEGAMRGGHIPARSRCPGPVPRTRTAPSSRARTSRRSTSRSRASTLAPTVAYCRIGERSSHTWFVLTHLLGFQNVRNYDGSWTEWGNAVRVPVVRVDHVTAVETADLPEPWPRSPGTSRNCLCRNARSLLEFSEELPELPERYAAAPERMEQVHECQSPLFLVVEVDEDSAPEPGGRRVSLYFSAPPEAPTTRGFAGILHEGLNRLTVDEILAVPEDAPYRFSLADAVSPLRSRAWSAC